MNKRGRDSLTFLLDKAAAFPFEKRLLLSRRKRLSAIGIPLLHSIFRSAPTGIGLISSRVILWVNDRFCGMVGYSREELTGRNTRFLYPTEEEFLRVGREKYAQMYREGRSTVETQFRRKDGVVIDILLSSAPLDQDDMAKGVTFTVLDITDRKSTERALQIERDLGLDLSCSSTVMDVLALCCNAALNSSGLDCGGVYIVDEKTGGISLVYHVGFSAEFASSVLSFGPDALQTRLILEGRPFYVNYERFCEDVLQEDKPTEEIRAFAAIPIKYQDKVIASLNLGSHKLEEIPLNTRTILETIASFVGEAIMVKQFENQLQYQANYDPLTELPNRVLAHNRLTQALRLAQWTQNHLAVMFVDLDQFKNVNDTLGHVAGDALLVEASKRIRGCMRGNDTIARFSGDLFLVLMPEIEDTDEVVVAARKIRNVFSESFELKDNEVFITPTIGIAVYPADGMDAENLLRNADTALHRAKTESRNAIRFYTREFNDKAHQKMEMEQHLRHALEKKEFYLLYQPLMDAQTGRLCGIEALLRWNSRKIGAIMPDQFISLAEENGLIIPIGEWVLNEACRQAKYLQEKMGFPLYVSVNISTRQLKVPGFSYALKKALDLSGLPAASLGLEVTETLLLDPGPVIHETLRQLNDLNVNLSIDDFGTGYSALSYLTKYSFHTLKIDRAFVFDIAQNSKNMALTQAIISMTHGLGMKVIGEGVETARQLEILKDQGCDFIQGFFISPPILPADLLEMEWSLDNPLWRKN